MFTIIGHLALEDGSPYLPGILGLIEEEIHSEFGGGDESDIRIQVLIEELGLSFIFRDTDIGDLTKEQRKKIDTYVAKIHENAIATL
jgi:hypothetical protein